MMLIKTSEPVRVVENMLEKRERRRRLARRHDRHQHEIRQDNAAISMLADALQDITASSRAWHHAKPHAAVAPKPGQNVTPGRSLRDVQNLVGEHIFPS